MGGTVVLVELDMDGEKQNLDLDVDGEGDTDCVPPIHQLDMETGRSNIQHLRARGRRGSPPTGKRNCTAIFDSTLSTMFVFSIFWSNFICFVMAAVYPTLYLHLSVSQ